ncbi:sensor domain-containing protein [Propionivibrio limicola]|uniref:sensor domain-containing protein n=1 Tax=Propionivibrio limicola TaxID=167645 RepID=UPI001290A1C8|nr:EAL domain-containing protein [Propionivibrio limicola]
MKRDEPSTAPEELPPELPKVIALLSWAGGAITTLLVPLVFLGIGYQSEVTRLESALQASIHNIERQTRALQNSGAKAAAGFLSPQNALASLDWLGDETRIRMTGTDQQLLAEKVADSRPPRLVRTAYLNLGERSIAQLEVSRSLVPLLYHSLLMLAPGLVFGLMVFFALRDVPMRALRLALQENGMRKTTEEQLAKSLAIFAATLESTADGIFVTDVHGREIVANQRFLDMWNLRRPAGSYTGDNETIAALAGQLRDPATFFSTQKDLTKHIDVNHAAILELRDGRRFEWNSRPQFVDGKVVGRVSSFRDITERGRAEALLAAEKEVLEMVVCGNPLKAALGVLARHVEVLSGEMFCAIMFRENGEGNSLACATGRNLPDNVADSLVHHGQTAFEKACADIASRGGPQNHDLGDEFSGVIEDIHVNPAWAEYRTLIAKYGIQACFAVAVRSSEGSLLGFIVAHYRTPADQPPHDRKLVWIAAHLTSIAIERRRAEDRLDVMAHYDALTLLPNRLLFRDRLNQALARVERHKDLAALLFIDLDRFKTINDTLGHDSGDLLLCEVSARLRQCVREVDTVARLGGDEFTVILEQINKPGDAAAIAVKIIEALATPILLRGQEAFVSPSIGITIFPSDSEDADQLVKNADTAMYRAKEDGGNGYRFFTTEMDVLTTGRLQMESGLRHALQREEFIVYYQAKLNLATGSIIGAEALLRWKHPTRGLVSPVEFVPILEETGLIEPVGEWVLRAVCTQIRAWQKDPSLPPLIVAANLSGRQLQRNNLASTVADILEETGLDPQFLELEVTESMLMHDPKWTVDMLLQLRNKGILHIDVDDFGTGYSSLSYLKQFPIDSLKLDKSFVDGLPSDEDDIAISQAVIALAHSLKLTVIAEGVEREEQLEFLRQNGCDVIQGYLVSRPLPADAFAQLVRDGVDFGPELPPGDAGKRVRNATPQSDYLLPLEPK